MYTPFSTILHVAALVAVAAAAPGTLEARQSQCNTGQLQCCNTTQQANPTTLTQLGGLLGLSLPNVAGLIGLNCSPITGIGIGGGSSCTAQAVCCTNNQFNGLINLGCSPINLSL